MGERKKLTERSSFGLLTDIKNNLAAFPNSVIAREAEEYVEELYRRIPKDIGGVQTEEIKRYVEIRCHKGVRPNTDPCTYCFNRNVCKLI